MLLPAKPEKSQPPFATPGIRLYIPSRDTLGSEPATRLIPTFIYPDFTTSNYPDTKRPLSAGISGSNCRRRSRVPTNSKRLDPRPSALFHTKPRLQHTNTAPGYTVASRTRTQPTSICHIWHSPVHTLPRHTRFGAIDPMFVNKFTSFRQFR